MNDSDGPKKPIEAPREDQDLKRFRTMADHIPQLAWMTRPDGYIFWYNQRWYDYTGTNLEQMRGWGWTKVHHPNEVARVVEKFNRSIAEGVAWEDTFPLRRRDGVYLWHLSRALPFKDDSGRVMWWFGTNTDITDRIELEAALKETDRRKDEFLATLAHELRNPLAPIVNAVELMRASGNDPQVAARLRAIIERQLKQMVRLIDDLLDLSRINRDVISLQRERADLAVVVRRAIETTRPLLEAGGHRLKVKEPDPPIFVDGDVIRLSQVVSNLLNNAAKFSGSRGWIEVTVGRAENQAVISVKDGGIGISAQMLPRVFDMFAQADQSLSRSHGGLGIGLTIAKKLVELHAGTIEALSDGAGMGSEFRVRLPIAPDTIDSPPDNDTGLPPVRGRRVLIVDDNRDAAETLATALQFEGHEVQIAYDGERAIEIAARLSPDLALLDIGMPGLDGYETARRLRDLPGMRRAAFVAITGWGQERDRERSREAGFHAHLVKPIDLAALNRLLSELPDKSD